MELTITDNMSERVEAKADEVSVFIRKQWFDQGEVVDDSAILLNKREATELHQFLGEWI